MLVFQLEVYYKVDRLLTGLPAQQKGTTARWYSNKTSLEVFYFYELSICFWGFLQGFIIQTLDFKVLMYNPSFC